MPTLEEQYSQAFLRQAQINDLLVVNQEQQDKLKLERDQLRGEREKVSQDMERLKAHARIETSETAVAKAQADADAIRIEAGRLKGELAARNEQADKLNAETAATLQALRDQQTELTALLEKARLDDAVREAAKKEKDPKDPS